MKRNRLIKTAWCAAFILSGIGTWAAPASIEDETDRKIAPSDTITIEVFREKDLSLETRVQASGEITFPLLGNVAVGGLTTKQVAALLKEKLAKDYLVNPAVTVNVKEYRIRTVSVMGAVEKPGAIKLLLEQKMDILEAIAEAGGFSRDANKSKIERTHKGKTERYKFDDLRKTKDPTKKILVEDGDVIYVYPSLL